jgi:hypothetical protein
VNGAHHAGVGNPVTAALKSARWLAVLIGLALAGPALLARFYGHHAGWPGAHAMSLLREVTFVAGIACLGVSTVIGGRACIRWWRQRRPAQPGAGLPAR